MNVATEVHEDWAERYGPWAVVTGASDGLGREFARALATRGLNLVLVSRSADALRLLADEIQHQHRVTCLPLALDLGEAPSIAMLDAKTRSLDVGLVVAAAGYGSLGPFLDQSLGNETDMLAVNAGAVLRIAHVFGHRLRDRGRGGLVMFSSIVGFQGVPLSANYAATKAYVQALAEALAFEWDEDGVDVLICAPGPVATGFAARAGMVMDRAADPAAVVAPCLDALGRRTTVRPGGLSKLLGYSLMTLPRPFRSRILGKIMRGMQPPATRGARP